MKDISKKALKEQYKNRTCIGGVYRVKCRENSMNWIRSTTDMHGSKNRFDFSVLTNSCTETYMSEVWNQFGASSFSFEILEEIQKKETQSEREFADDVTTLLEMWTEKLKETENILK